MSEVDATAVTDAGTAAAATPARPGRWPMPSWGYRHFVAVLLGTWLLRSGGMWALERVHVVPAAEKRLLVPPGEFSIVPESEFARLVPRDMLTAAALLALLVGLVVARRATWRGLGFRGLQDRTRTGIVLGLFAGLQVLRIISRLRHPIPESQWTRGTDSPVEFFYAFNAHSGPGGLVLAAVACVVLLPFVYETVFRGLLYPRLRANLGVTAAVLLSAAASAAFQPINLYWTVPLFVMGVLSAWLVERSRSIYPAFLVNGLGNAVLLAVDFLP